MQIFDGASIYLWLVGLPERKVLSIVLFTVMLVLITIIIHLPSFACSILQWNERSADSSADSSVESAVHACKHTAC
jgi:hypothetical protein